MTRLAVEYFRVGEIIRFIEGAGESVDCLEKPDSNHCHFGAGAFPGICWKAGQICRLSDIFDATTFQDLVDKQRATNLPNNRI